jgi:capsule polysaccharide modification protein KpsS
VKALWDRDNDWLRPWPWLRRILAERARVAAGQRLASPPPAPGARYVYFPLHVVEDCKIKKLLPHCYDQGAIIELVAASLPHGVELIAKEHPLAIGRTPLALLRRIDRLPNARVVPAATNSHDLIENAAAIVTIGSTVGLEALLYRKPVLTLGDPFYAGAGVTIDVASFAEIPRAVPEALTFTPDPERITAFLAAAMDRCLPGRPVLMDRSDENAVALAATLERGALDPASALEARR